jgi:4-hydroxybenzoate polyprenyltransferase
MEAKTNYSLPLCVDLDGTLLKSDSLWESVLILLKKSPLKLFLCFWWLLGGKANLKTKIAQNVLVDVKNLPYNAEFLNYLKSEKASGRELYLATGAHFTLAESIATHLDIFSGVFGTNEKNRVGSHKYEVLRQKFGKNGFMYAGNSKEDLHVWKECEQAILVHPSFGLEGAARKVTNVVKVFNKPKFSLNPFLKCLRVHQWVKNALIFVPLIAAHKISNLESLNDSIFGFFSFSLCASSVYVLNDLLDINDDRRHRTKRDRPFASGSLPIWFGIVLFPLLLVSSLLLAVNLSSDFFYLLLLYVALTSAYTFVLKSVVLWDIIILAGLYTLRIFVGGVLAAPVSPWLLAFSAFFFLSLALTKRYTELLYFKKTDGEKAPGRGYQVDDIEFISSLGVAAGYMALVIFVLYINSADVTKIYSHPIRLWGLVPLLFYWISRVWLLTHRGQIADDPVLFAIKDRASYFIFAIGACVMFLAL